MILKDQLYGLVDVKEAVIQALLESAPIIRLKRINQAGASQYLFPWKTISRYEHSVGVMLLLRKFGAPLNEQIAGLLHDVPHTAFSHVADFVFANPHHEFHELFHEDLVLNSEIGQLLKKFKIPPTVAHPENFPLLEKDVPDLCADRIDYALRDVYSFTHDRERMQTKLSGLTVYKNEFVFEDYYAAETFANDYLEFDRRVWADPRETAAYVLLAQAITHALDKRILTIADLFKDDEYAMRILKEKGDPFIRKKIGYLTPAFRIEEASRNHYHLFVKTKTRYVDPKIIAGNKVQRLSEISNKFKKRLEEHKDAGQKGWYIHIYPQ